MKPLIFAALLLTAALLATPAAAELIGALPDGAHEVYAGWTSHIDLDAYNPNKEVIGEVLLRINPGTTVEFSLHTNNQEITGEINRTSTSPSSEIITYRIGDQVSGPHESSTLFGLWDLGENTYSVRYGAGSDGTLRVWLQNHNRGVGWQNPAYNISNVAYRFSAVASRDVYLSITTADAGAMNKKISEIWDLGDSGPLAFLAKARELGALLWGLMEGVSLVISLGWYLFRKIFIENFLLFAALFEIVGMAYAANKSRDFFQFLRKVVDYNTKAIKGMYWLIERMVTILSRIINALIPL